MMMISMSHCQTKWFQHFKNTHKRHKYTFKTIPAEIILDARNIENYIKN